MAMLPYVTATGNVDKALMGIKAAATPAKVTQDFVKTILKVKGGSGDQMTSFLKKIGFVNADSTPSDIYTRFRNSSTAGAAAAAALRHGYAPLYKRNEFWHALGDNEIRGLVLEETGLANDSPIVSMIINSMKSLKKFAAFEPEGASPDKPEQIEQPLLQPPAPQIPPQIPAQSLGLNIGYTINLNLPATSDIAVFNAIFKSLKENLLKASDG